MKKFWVILAMVLIVLAYILLGFGTVISVGYGLYAWAIADVAFKVALWTAFITWIKLIALGLTSMTAGFLVTALAG
ncbi:hypothetical protein D3C87_323540 [compost metagenome]